MGAPGEDSSATGVFASGDAGYQAALDSDGANGSGAIYVYRRSGLDRWALEAFVKTPVAGGADVYADVYASPGATGSDVVSDSLVQTSPPHPAGLRSDLFGRSFALSRDGATLAVGARREDSSATGAFAPGDAGYRAALDSDGAEDSGAAYVYRRSTAGRWALEAFIKAPVAGAGGVGAFPGASGGDFFGGSLALSADGSALAVGATREDSGGAGAFAPTNDGYQAALDSDGAEDSGAVYFYHRSGGTWTLSDFVKAPVADAGDRFGEVLALDSSGTTLAVGSPGETGGGWPQPRSGRFDDAEDVVEASGAAYLY